MADPTDGSFEPGKLPPFDSQCLYGISILCLGSGIEFIYCVGYGSGTSSQGFSFKSEQPAPGIYGKFGKRTKHLSGSFYTYQIDRIPEPPVGHVEIRRLGFSRPVAKGDLIKGAGPWFGDDAPKIGTNVTTYGAAFYSHNWTSYHNLSASEAANFSQNFMNQWPMRGYPNYRLKIDQKCPGDTDWIPLNNPFTTSNPLVYRGTAAPPPPPPKKMNCCDCNTIATIIEERLAQENKPIKDHIDQRTIEQLRSINKMLQGMTIDLNLQPVIDRLNEVEANLWNGPRGK